MESEQENTKKFRPSLVYWYQAAFSDYIWKEGLSLCTVWLKIGHGIRILIKDIFIVVNI